MGLDGPDDARVLLGGGIGAGKSTVAEEFGRFGFTVFDADAVGAEVLRPGTDATDAVAQRWPAVVSNGVVDRKSLAQIVFSDAEELQRLESMTHPSIRDEIKRLVSLTPGSILVETPLQHLTMPGDWFRVAVIADQEVRIARAVSRGGDASDIRNRVASQLSDNDWVRWADTVIDNSGAWSETMRSIEAVVDEVTK
jgi:dephospho-CoA kinase